MAQTLANSETPQIYFGGKEVEVITEWEGDLLAVGVTEKDIEEKDENSRFGNPILKELDSKLDNGLLANYEQNFTGKLGQFTVVKVTGGVGSKNVALIGLGNSASSSTMADFMSFGEAVAAAAKSTQATNVAIVLASSESLSAQSKPNIASAIASGTILGIIEDKTYKAESKKHVEIIGLGTGPELEKKLKDAEILSSGIICGREAFKSPGVLAQEATKVAFTYSDVFTAKILNEEQCKKLKMGSFLGVTAASANPPYFIHLCYKSPSGPINSKLALLGKENDVSSGAAVLGAAKAIGQLKPIGVEVHFIVAPCEKMISGTGMRPGDIFTAPFGKTIEVNNTDAKGRLAQVDALVYAANQGDEKIVDLATLTGACVVDLGPSIAGLFTHHDELAKEILEASEVRGEKLWRMPKEVNTGGPLGDAINAALSLKQFVDDKVQLLHIDMAGLVASEKKQGATGLGIPTLVEWVLRNAS